LDEEGKVASSAVKDRSTGLMKRGEKGLSGVLEPRGGDPEGGLKEGRVGSSMLEPGLVKLTGAIMGSDVVAMGEGDMMGLKRGMRGI
jgi:hypothetical protein